jgi:hypothetical protein
VYPRVWRELAAFKQEDVMSTNVTGDVPQVPSDPAPVQTPTITHYQQIAANLAKAIDDMLALIPSLMEPHPSTTGFVRRHQNVPLEFIATAIASVEANPALQGAGILDVTEARDSLQFIDAFRPMADRLNAAAASLTFSIDTRRANASTSALQVYAVAKGVARVPQNTSVATHVANLKRDLGRAGRGGRKKVTPTPTPVPVPAAPKPAVIGGLTADEQA